MFKFNFYFWGILNFFLKPLKLLLNIRVTTVHRNGLQWHKNTLYSVQISVQYLGVQCIVQTQSKCLPFVSVSKECQKSLSRPNLSISTVSLYHSVFALLELFYLNSLQ